MYNIQLLWCFEKPMELVWYKMHAYINQDYDIVSKCFFINEKVNFL